MKVASCGILLVLCALLVHHSVVEGQRLPRWRRHPRPDPPTRYSVDDDFYDEAAADYGMGSALGNIQLKQIINGIKGGIAGYKGRGHSVDDDFYDEADADYNILQKLKGLNFNDIFNKGKTALQQLRGRSVDDDFYDEADADYGLGGALKVLSKVPYKKILKGGQAAIKGGNAIYNQVQARRGHSVDDDFYDEADADYSILQKLKGLNIKELLNQGKAALQQFRGRSVDDDFYDEADADYGMLSRFGGAVARAGQVGRAAYGY